MLTQKDIYVDGSKTHPPMLNKENYVPWSSRLLRYAKSKPNGKLIYNSIMNGSYVRRMIQEPGDVDREVPVNEPIMSRQMEKSLKRNLNSQAPTVASHENINQAEMVEENAQVENDKFINIFCTPIQDRGETSSYHVDSSKMHTFYQHHPSEHRWTKDHPLEHVIGNPSQSVRTRRQLESDGEMCMFALTEELYQFDRLHKWELVDRPLSKNVINMKWLWKNKRDEENTVIRNKSRLVAKGYSQKERVDFEESFAPVARLELFVYRLKKALYGLKQAPRAWYDELSTFLVSKGFSKGSIDPTLFITKHKGHILLVKIYVDDIIFGSTKPKLSKQFEKLMHSKFEMSMMGELKFFLGIQIHQSPRGIFINQAKYAQEILIKHGMTSCDSVGTLMATKHLDADLSGTPVDQTKYRSMVRTLMYLTASRPDIMHATCYCARYQAKPTEKHLTAVKRIFRYLKDTIHMGLWYSKDTGFKLIDFLDSDHVGCLDLQAEYVSLSACCAQFLWMRTQLTDYGFHFDKIPIIEYQLADMFTKALPEERFKYLIKRLEMNEHKGRMQTKIELELEESQQGVCNDILNVRNQNGLIVVLGIGNQNLNLNGNGKVVAARSEGNAIRNNGDPDEIKEVNANWILMDNWQQASTSGTQTDKAPVYDSNGSAEKFLGTARFGNDHVDAILRYGDLQ
nr:hypothetical protein [Tanacetum cinerariifolium]